MRLYSATESYLFQDDRFENGVVSHTFNFIPGSKTSRLFNQKEAIDFIAKEAGCIYFRTLDGRPYCFVNFNQRTYADVYDDNFSSIAGSLIDTSEDSVAEPTPYLDDFAKKDGEIYFFLDDFMIMVDLWCGEKRGSFRYTTAKQFIKNVESFNKQNNDS